MYNDVFIQHNVYCCTAALIADASGQLFSIDPREVRARMDSPTVRAIIDMGYSRDVIRRTIEEKLVTTGQLLTHNYVVVI